MTSKEKLITSGRGLGRIAKLIKPQKKETLEEAQASIDKEQKEAKRRKWHED